MQEIAAKAAADARRRQAEAAAKQANVRQAERASAQVEAEIRKIAQMAPQMPPEQGVTAVAVAVDKNIHIINARLSQMSQALDSAMGNITQIAKEQASLGQLINAINRAVQEAIASADAANKNVYTLAANIEANLAAIDQQMRGQGDAIAELSRGMVETFTPRQAATAKAIARAQATRAKKLAKRKKVSTSQAIASESEIVATAGGPGVAPALEGWGWATALHS